MGFPILILQVACHFPGSLFGPPPVILVWVTRSNCASAGTVLIVLLKPLGTAHGVLIRPITGHGGFWTNSTKLKTLTICWCSETSGGVWRL